MRMQLEIELIDGSKQEVKVLMADMVRFESQFNLSIAKLGQEMKVTHLLWLGWSALYREKATNLDFDTWVETVASVGATDPKASKG